MTTLTRVTTRTVLALALGLTTGCAGMSGTNLAYRDDITTPRTEGPVDMRDLMSDHSMPLFAGYTAVKSEALVRWRQDESEQRTVDAFRENFHSLVARIIDAGGVDIEHCEVGCGDGALVVQFKESDYDILVPEWGDGRQIRGTLSFIDGDTGHVLRTVDLASSGDHRTLFTAIHRALATGVLATRFPGWDPADRAGAEDGAMVASALREVNRVRAIDHAYGRPLR